MGYMQFTAHQKYVALAVFPLNVTRRALREKPNE